MLSGCLAAAAVGATVRVAGAVVGTGATVAVKTTGAVVDAAIPDKKNEKKDTDN